MASAPMPDEGNDVSLALRGAERATATLREHAESLRATWPKLSDEQSTAGRALSQGAMERAERVLTQLRRVVPTPPSTNQS